MAKAVVAAFISDNSIGSPHTKESVKERHKRALYLSDKRSFFVIHCSDVFWKSQDNVTGEGVVLVPKHWPLHMRSPDLRCTNRGTNHTLG